MKTRMHSSRMRTVRNSSRLLVGGGVCFRGVPGPRGCLLLGGVYSGGCLILGGGGVWSRGVCSGGVSAPGALLLGGGGIPACTEADPPV